MFARRRSSGSAALVAGAASLLALAACQKAEDLATATVNTPVAAVQGVPTLVRADGDMDAVLLALQALGPKPFPTLTAQEARQQPTLADAVKKVLQDRGQDASPMPKMARLRNVAIPGPGGSIPARVYTPAGRGPFPVVVYYHGGGWVIADPRVYDASARAMAEEAKAIVVSVDYRRGPENRFRPRTTTPSRSTNGRARTHARSAGTRPAWR
jgi:acetyl esterase/lipase